MVINLSEQSSWSAIVEGNETLLDRVRRHGHERPDARAIIDGDRNVTLTFAQLQLGYEALASILARKGLTVGNRIAVFSRDPALTIIAMLASWRLGAVYVGLNHNLSGELLTRQVIDADLSAIVTDDQLRPVLNAAAPNANALAIAPNALLAGDGEEAGTESNGSQTPELPHYQQPSPLADAAIVFTSGTTGPAKAVRLSHRWIDHYTFLARTMLEEDDVVYCDLPLYHVGGAFSLVGRALWRGVPVAVWSKFSTSGFWKRIEEVGATCAILLDVMAPWVREAADRSSRSTLRTVHLQPLPKDFRKLAQELGLTIVTCGFGQTETGAVCAAVLSCVPQSDESLATVAWRDRYLEKARGLGVTVMSPTAAVPDGYAGSPSPMLEIKVAGSNGEAVGAGETGALLVRSSHPGVLLSGYQNRSTESIEGSAGRWFETGDFVRNLGPSGIAFVERSSGFMRVRGENVSAAEVEAVIQSLPEVKMVAAVGVPAAAGLEDDIAVFVVPRAGMVCEPQTIHDFSASRMPRYMRPTIVRICDALPLTPTGKIEKGKLKALLIQERASGLDAPPAFGEEGPGT
jgi:carnitine-CoA ligase